MNECFCTRHQSYPRTVEVLFKPPNIHDATNGGYHCPPCFMSHVTDIKGRYPCLENIAAFKKFLEENPEIGLEI